MPDSTNIDANYEFYQKLRKKFDRHRIAELTGYSVNTIQGWIAPTTSTRWRPIPDRAIELAKLKLAAEGITID